MRPRASNPTPIRNHEHDSGVHRKLPIIGAIDRRTVIGLLEAGRHQDLLGLLRDARRHQPYDLEIMRSIRVLETYLSRAS